MIKDELRSKAAFALLCMQRYSWEQGVTMQAFYEMNERDTVLALAQEAAYRRLPDGRTAMLGNMNAVTDPCSVGEALLWACDETGDPVLCDALTGLKNWALRLAPRNSDGIVYHVLNSPQMWVDSMYMLPPFLAAVGEHDEAMRQARGYAALLLDPDTGLFRHQWHDGERRFLRPMHWGVGNGWALAAYARLIGLMPEHREELARCATDLIGALLPYMRPDGLFHDSIDDTATFVETNLAQMLCYTLCRGMRENWLSADYMTIAERLHAATVCRADKYGIARGVCGAPGFDKPGAAPEGQAFLLMMETEWLKLSR